MTHFLQDILRQPAELQRTINYLCGEGRPKLEEAAGLLRSAHHVYLTGIGSSWHAALSAGPLFYLGARPAYMQEASELLQFFQTAAECGNRHNFTQRPKCGDR